MSTRFDVTVIVPTYQGAAYIDECLQSIAAQDLAGVEVLVLDDCSTDDTVEKASSYSDRIPSLRVMRNPQRLGAVSNVNRCIEMARGRWIKPVFQDDLIEPGCLAAMRAARRRKVSVVVCARTYRYEDGVPDWQRDACEVLVMQSLVRRFGSGVVDAGEVAAVAADAVAKRVPQLNFVGEPVSMLLDRRSLRRAGGFDPGYVQLWDYELPVRLAMRGGMVLVDEPLAVFRVHGESETARNLSGSAFGINVLDRLRIQIAYATQGAYAPVRAAALRHDPPTGILASAVGVAAAARRISEELPEAEGPPATRSVEALAAVLPSVVPPGTPAPWDARNAEMALLLELSDRELPDHLRDDLQVSPVDSVGTVDATPAGVSDDAPGTASVDGGRSTSSMLHKLTGLPRALRTNQWWGHMLGPIVAFGSLQLGWRQVPPGAGIARLLALLWTSITLAAYGYVVNDASDVEPDRSAGKRNAMERLPIPGRLALIVGLAVLGGLPWLFIGLEPEALTVLGLVYLCPLIYSTHPIRLKERLVGPLVDAANAFVLPAVFTIFLYEPFGDATGPPALMLVGTLLWTWGFGLRAILKHQLDDLENDRRSGTRTLALVVGVVRTRRLAHQVLFPIELAGLVLLTGTIVTWSWATAVVGIGYGALFHGMRVTGVIHRGLATTTLDRGWWMYWYQVWPALLVSLGLAAWDPWYILVTVLVVVCFWPRVPTGLEIFARESRRELGRVRSGRTR